MKTKILLADDERDLEDLFKQQFRRQIQQETYEFIFVRDGREALTMLEQQPDIDVVLSDLNMPGMDGLTLLARLSDMNPFIRTVIVTAYGDMDNIRTAMNRGAFDFITKPINFEDLKATIDKTIRQVQQLRETAELKALDEMKTRFFANITHELRTPLTLIVSPVDKLLETPDLPIFYQQQLSTVRRNALQLLRLINQLLDINKLEARQMELVQEVGDLPRFIGQVVELFRPSTDIKQLTLTYQPDMLPSNYLFDAGKWETILFNLLANAIKFTHTGEITVHLAQVGDTANLTVRDTGIGISVDKLPHIFNRFWQAGPRSADNARNRAYEGTGIGLALVHELTNRLGGTIWVESQPSGSTGQGGTCFVVSIPVQSMNDHRDAAQQDAQTAIVPTGQIDLPYLTHESTPGANAVPPGEQPLILIVEDNAELRDFMVAELATTYRVLSADNGLAGWLLAKEELPDVIISDLMMPVMDGYELIDRVRNDATTDHIAIMLLTASSEADNRQKGLEHGADEYLTKPFNMRELRLRLRNLLGRQQKLREQYRQQFAQPDSPGALVSVSDQFLQRVYQLVEQHLDDSALSVEWLAEQLAMSRKTFYRKVQSLVQLSPVDLIRQYRLRKSIDLLKAGHNASETAYMLGFESPSYFARVFREFYHQSPTEYLNRT